MSGRQRGVVALMDEDRSLLCLIVGPAALLCLLFSRNQFFACIAIANDFS